MGSPRRPIHILIADADARLRDRLSEVLFGVGYVVSVTGEGRRAIGRAAEGDVDVLLLDLALPDLGGLEVLNALHAISVSPSVIVLSAPGAIDTVEQAIRLGAFDYLEKPCTPEKLLVAVRRAYDHLRLAQRHRILEDGYTATRDAPGFVGKSAAFEKVRESIERIGPSDGPTLILGETGVGKETVARLLHVNSPRRQRPFVVLDCTAIQPTLLQSELFGHEEGAFTGATRRKHGLFEVAHTGTIFLDEAGDMSPDVQANLLRVLETGQFRRVGGTREVSVDVRLISATHRNIREAVAKQLFREDLFFRLTTFTIEIPPLRERPEDIPLLIEHFTARANERTSRGRTFSPEAMKALEQYSWPGNVRELAHVIERVLVLANDDEIGLGDIPVELRTGPTCSVRNVLCEHLLSLKEMERQYVLDVLKRVGGNRARAAQVLEVSERNLYRLLKRYGVTKGETLAAGGKDPA